MYSKMINTKLCEITGELYKRIDAEIEGAIQPQGFVRFAVRTTKLSPWYIAINLTKFCSLSSDEIAYIIYCEYRNYIEKQFLKG